MKKLLTILSLLALTALVAGCGEETDTAAETTTDAATETAETVGDAVESAAETVTETATDAIEAAEDAVEALEEAAAVADCAGECGMKDLPKDTMTEIDGKLYCPACTAKLKADEHLGHDHG